MFMKHRRAAYRDKSAYQSYYFAVLPLVVAQPELHLRINPKLHRHLLVVPTSRSTTTGGDFMYGKDVENCISERSHALWEREGREPGREEDYRARARAEVEHELRLALEGHVTDVVPPQLSISRRPIRRSA